VADEQNFIVVLREPGGFAMHLGDKRARRVNGVELAIGGSLNYRRRDAVGAEDHMGASGNLGDVIHEDRAALFKGRNNVHVVDDLLAHIDGRTEALERLLDGDYRSIHSRTIAARGSKEHTLGSGDGVVP
ncbi:MAG: hypothetical protein QOF79_2277, partial [Actinomycetota bacterium]|nr:hypothetical protein [Actinomycetota bacterium]